MRTIGCIIVLACLFLTAQPTGPAFAESTSASSDSNDTDFWTSDALVPVDPNAQLQPAQLGRRRSLEYMATHPAPPEEKWMPKGAVAVDSNAGLQSHITKEGAKPRWTEAPVVPEPPEGFVLEEEESLPVLDPLVGILWLSLIVAAVFLSFVGPSLLRWLFRWVSGHSVTGSGGMNRQQRICLWAGIAVFVLMGLFPPWYVYRGRSETCFCTYSFLLTPPGTIQTPMGMATNDKHKLDTHRLYIQWAMVVVVTVGLMLTFHRKQEGQPPVF